VSDSDAPIVLSFSLTKPEVYGVVRRWLAAKRVNVLFPLAGLSFVLGGAADSNAWVIAFGVLFTACGLYGLLWGTPKRLWASAEKGEQHHRISKDGWEADLPTVSARYQWDYWREASLVGETYVFESRGGLILVPRRALSGDEEARFRDYCGSLLEDARS
jgi:hypothetical protein